MRAAQKNIAYALIEDFNIKCMNVEQLHYWIIGQIISIISESENKLLILAKRRRLVFYTSCTI